jgi:hypothetical protein
MPHYDDDDTFREESEARARETRHDKYLGEMLRRIALVERDLEEHAATLKQLLPLMETYEAAEREGEEEEAREYYAERFPCAEYDLVMDGFGDRVAEALDDVKTARNALAPIADLYHATWKRRNIHEAMWDLTEQKN